MKYPAFGKLTKYNVRGGGASTLRTSYANLIRPISPQSSELEEGALPF